MKEAIFTFIRAVFWGSMVGGGPFLLMTVPIAMTEGSLYRLSLTLWVAILPLVFAGALVLPASVFLGLPLTAVLAGLKAERATTYALAGLGLGTLLPIAVALYDGIGWHVGLVVIAFFGAAAGLTTATIWGQWREGLANRAEHCAGQPIS